MLRLVWISLVGAASCWAADVTGKIVDARGGEPLANVRVRVAGSSHTATSASDGSFSLTGVPDGRHTLTVETVGYRMIERPFDILNGQPQSFEIILSPDTFRRIDSVQVSSGPFETTSVSSPSQSNLTGTEVKNLGTVVLDDPIRAIHALPGVVSNDDMYSQFAVRGATFRRVGVYLDGILLHQPFHTVQGINDSASISLLNTDLLENITLMPEAFSSKFGDRTASVIDAQSREGSRTKPSVRVSAGFANLTGLAEGPIASGRGSWLVSARQSYVRYLANQVEEDPSLGIDFRDYQGKLTFDVTPSNTVTLQFIDGTTGVNRSDPDDLGVNSPQDMDYRATISRAGWRFTSSRLVANASAAYMRERHENTNVQSLPLDRGHYGEWVGNVDAVWSWSARNPLEFGYSARKMRDEGVQLAYFRNTSDPRFRNEFRGRALRQGGYIEQTWTLKALRVSAGTRWDHHELLSITPVSPHASAVLTITPTTQFQLGWGQYVQFPELSFLTMAGGGSHLLPERANHYMAAIEQRIGSQFRIRVEGFNRADRDLLTQPLLDPRLDTQGRIVFPNNGRVFNSARGYTRGVEVVVQRRSANRLTGWVGYTLQYTNLTDRLENEVYPSSADQRHTVNAYGSYRITPSLNFSARWAYGSGTPVGGFFRREGENYFLAPERNRLTLGDYQRLDLRVNKSFRFEKGKLTLYGELINATGHDNQRVTSFNGFDAATRAFLTTQTVFPRIPTAGVMVEF